MVTGFITILLPVSRSEKHMASISVSKGGVASVLVSCIKGGEASVPE